VRVNKTQTLARLQTLLERIRVRSKERRFHAAVTPPHVDTLVPGPMPAMTSGFHPAGEVETEAEIAIDVDVSDAGQADGVEDAAGEAVLAPAGSDSAERLVVAGSPSSAPPAVLAAEAIAPPRERIPNTLESVGEFEPELPTDAIDSVDEPAPASSRRPVAAASDNHLTLAFGPDEPRPPRHTPPPESGRLPSPVGGAFEDDGDGDIGEVRIDSPGRSLATALVPETTRATLDAAHGVADVIGEAQRFSPATFLMLLDASIEL
jgi:hypothetical protein